MQEEQDARQAIAIVGMSGRFPGADNLEDFWHILERGEDMCREVPMSENFPGFAELTMTRSRPIVLTSSRITTYRERNETLRLRVMAASLNIQTFLIETSSSFRPARPLKQIPFIGFC